MDVKTAPDIKMLVKRVLLYLPLGYIKSESIHCMRSFQATSRARARIWSFPKIWQQALTSPPQYIIEVLSQHFDHLSSDDKTRVLIHELMHIPKNFSGALVPHKSIHKRIDTRLVENLFQMYKQADKKIKK